MNHFEISGEFDAGWILYRVDFIPNGLDAWVDSIWMDSMPQPLFNLGSISFLFAVDDMPIKLSGMSTLQDPEDSSTLVVSGGYIAWSQDEPNPYAGKDQSDQSAAILKLTCTMEEDCKWYILSYKLKVPRSYHVSFFTNKPLNCTTFDYYDEKT